MATTLRNFLNTCGNSLDAPLRQHLKNVYACLAMSTLTFAAGAYVHLYTEILKGGLLMSLGALGLLIALFGTQDDGKNRMRRLSYLLGFSFLSGLGMGPTLEVVMSIDPSIVMTAVLGTAVIFVSFSLSALFAKRGQWLYLGGALMGTLNFLLLLSILNFFFRSSLIYQAHLYLGFFLMCGFIIYDTQLIVEKHAMGSTDFILHSLDLFADFVGVFRHLLVILTQKTQQNNRKE
ncbi:probable Bax inhibitor 1 [Orussus abietinus]|uniref:probable Bax inhibitor 1 n=1 Tax=Orussus abietinus TaxID=222816 RepID=UPI0006260F58|nr:probable Bax inhibitor 1 [Orussus abietinus]